MHSIHLDCCPTCETCIYLKNVEYAYTSFLYQCYWMSFPYWKHPNRYWFVSDRQVHFRARFLRSCLSTVPWYSLPWSHCQPTEWNSFKFWDNPGKIGRLYYRQCFKLHKSLQGVWNWLWQCYILWRQVLIIDVYCGYFIDYVHRSTFLRTFWLLISNVSYC